MTTDSHHALPQGLLRQRPPTEKSANAELEAAKLEALAEFAAGAGHEINNPLAIISGRVQMLLRDETDPQRRQALLTIGGQANRIRDMIGDCMLFARPPEPTPQRLNLPDAIRTVLRTLADSAADRGCTFEFSSAENVSIWADSVQLSVVLAALLRNSLEPLVDGGPIRIEAQTLREDDRDWAVFCVLDRGPGFTPAERERLFDPFFSGRQAGRGLGFGLSKCWRIVSNHGGRIDAGSAPDEETWFQVYWPAQPQA